MAGIGVKLNNIYDKQTLTTNVVGMGYSTVVTIAPMIVVITTMILMQELLDFSTLGYASRELFASTILYIFIFSLLTAAPFNSVLSRYLSDIIYEERYQDILPCYYLGLIINVLFSSLFGIPFCVREVLVGKVDIPYVFVSYCGYMLLMIVFYSMLYLSICKDYGKISYFFFLGMTTALLVALILVYWFNWEKTFAMLVAFDVGFFLIGGMECSVVRSYFRENSGQYKRVLVYFKKYWQLMATNFLYTLGMFIHNFVFWTSDLRMVVVDCFVSATAYDMATCLALFTNVTSSVIFISRVEMRFHERYKAYSEAVIGGRGIDIEITKKRMFRQLSEELMNLVRIQFVISVIIFFVALIVLPRFGFGGLVIQIYPCMAAGYFIMFTMYAAIIFLYYFNDLTGALITAATFCGATFIASIVATFLPEIWYGIGIVIGAFCGWSVAYDRLHWLEENLDVHVFCNGNILKRGKGKKQPAKVFDRYEQDAQKQKKEV